MRRTRVIPILLMKRRGLYKTRRFKNPVYIGDPINTMRIFNDKEVDEIAVLDIEAPEPDFDYIEDLISESFMPLAYGGGIATVDHAKRLFALGVEKVVLNTAAANDPRLIRQIADISGTQSVVVSIDVKKSFLGGEHVYIRNGRARTAYAPVEFAKRCVEQGAGELMITSIAHEGMMQGYNMPLIRSITDAVDVPVIAHGGAKSLADLKSAIKEGHASAVAAGSMFVFQGPHRAVLISYPSPEELASLNA